jgi:LysR family transcriptional regulator, hypochlorite-specific transcription factor HypT
VDTKLLEDLAALAETGSLSRAAALRHVTHPAFGRRIRQLEAWAQAALVDRSRSPVSLTPAGKTLLEASAPLLAALARTRRHLRAHGDQPAGSDTVRVGTGRTLARTLVARWLAQQRKALNHAHVSVVTRSMAEVAALFESGEVDLLCCYEHPSLSLALSPSRFRSVTLAQDRLVPVTGCTAQGQARHALGDRRRIDFAPTLALSRLVRDHLDARVSATPAAVWAAEQATLVSDSADAIQAFVRLGLGYAWLPWSLVADDCKQGVMAPIGGPEDRIAFDVRLYRPRPKQTATLEALWLSATG